MTPAAYYDQLLSSYDGVSKRIISDNAHLREQLRTLTGIAIPELSDDLERNLYNACLQFLVNELPQEMRSQVEGRVYAGVFPTGQYNAEANRIPGRKGYLFLLNLGLNQLIYHTAKLLMSRATYGSLDNVAESAASSTDKPHLTTIEAADRFQQILDRYESLSQLDLKATMPLPLLTSMPSMLIPVGLLVVWTECFVLAHELAHAVLGHLDQGSDRKLAVATSQKTIVVISKSFEEELQADRLAMWIILQIAPRCPLGPFANLDSDDIDPRLKNLACQSAIAGPFWFLEIGRHIEKMRQTDSTTHPCCADRARYLASYLSEIGVDSSALALSETYLHVFRTFAPQLTP